MSRARPGRAGEAYGRLSNATQNAPVVGGDAVAPRHHDATASLGKPVRRFSSRFYDLGDTEGLDDWLRDARRLLGFKVDASRLVRELVRELHDDPELTARVHARLRAEEQPIQR